MGVTCVEKLSITFVRYIWSKVHTSSVKLMNNAFYEYYTYDCTAITTGAKMWFITTNYALTKIECLYLCGQIWRWKVVKVQQNMTHTTHVKHSVC